MILSSAFERFCVNKQRTNRNMKINVLCILLILIAFKMEAQIPHLIPYQENDKWGFVDKELNIIIEAKYDSVSVFYNNRSVIKVNKKYGLIDEKGKYIIKPRLRKGLENLGKSGILVTTRKGKYLFFDENGERIKEIGVGYYCGNGLPFYLKVDKYSIREGDKIALIYNKVKSGDNNNPIFLKDTTAYQYSSIETFGTKSFIVKDSLGAGIWMPDELYVKVSTRHENIEVTKGIFQNSYLHKYRNNGKTGLIDTNGNVVAKAKYHSIWLDYSRRRIDKLIKVEYEPNKFGYISNSGNEYF